jgi:hypothetical protein
VCSADETASRGDTLHLLYSPIARNELLSASSIVPGGSTVEYQSGDGSLGVPTDSISGSGRHGSGSFHTLGLVHDYSRNTEELQFFHRQGGSVLHGERPRIIPLQTMSAANESDAQSWSGFHLRNDQPAIFHFSDVESSMLPEEASQTTHAWDFSSSSFSFLDDTDISASFSASGSQDDDPADACTLDQSIVTVCPGNTADPWRIPWNHVDLEGHDGQQESFPPSLPGEREWVDLEHVQEG